VAGCVVSCRNRPLSWELMDNQTKPRNSVKASGEQGMNRGSAGVGARQIAPYRAKPIAPGDPASNKAARPPPSSKVRLADCYSAWKSWAPINSLGTRGAGG
jgi:hypothetical protein